MLREKTSGDDARLNVDIDRAELIDLKRKALDAGTTLKKYIRVRLGLDAPEKGKK
jgi:hypothetical protein